MTNSTEYVELGNVYVNDVTRFFRAIKRIFQTISLPSPLRFYLSLHQRQVAPPSSKLFPSLLTLIPQCGVSSSSIPRNIRKRRLNTQLQNKIPNPLRKHVPHPSLEILLPRTLQELNLPTPKILSSPSYIVDGEIVPRLAMGWDHDFRVKGLDFHEGAKPLRAEGWSAAFLQVLVAGAVDCVARYD